VGFIFDSGLQSDCSNNKFSTPLHIAAGRRGYEAAKLLTVRGVRMPACDEPVNNILQFAE
jgi:ankyrin repeat protein